jgi:hypothetical protein
MRDRDGACPTLRGLHARFKNIALVWADGFYAGLLVTWTGEGLRLALQFLQLGDNARRDDGRIVWIRGAELRQTKGPDGRTTWPGDPPAGRPRRRLTVLPGRFSWSGSAPHSG